MECLGPVEATGNPLSQGGCCRQRVRGRAVDSVHRGLGLCHRDWGFQTDIQVRVMKGWRSLLEVPGKPDTTEGDNACEVSFVTGKKAVMG